jgi:catechol 2,3-dioxygenase-like lactoylglutathione lyase family enzyme
MAADQDAHPWTIRSTLIAVADLNRSIAFYEELGPFAQIARDDAVALLGVVSPEAVVLILRETRSTHHIRHGQQSLGLRSLTFNVGSQAELDRVESVLRDRDLLTSRQQMSDGAAELVYGRDPDNLPLIFMHYMHDLGPDYFKEIVRMVYSLDS